MKYSEGIMAVLRQVQGLGQISFDEKGIWEGCVFATKFRDLVEL